MDRTNRNTALASAFVEELARCGLRRAVLSPGSRSTPLAVALWRAPEVDVTVIVDERSAAFFALGAAQASGAPVAILCTSGTAAANFHPAVCEADHSALPLLVLSADRPPELRGIGAGQTIDQLKLYGSSVRWFCEVGTHEADDDGLLHYRSTACRAFAAARGEPRPGPVHLNFAWREPLAPLPAEGAVTATDPLALEGRGERPLTAVTPIDVEPSQFLLDEVAGHIEEADIGVIVAGRQLDAELREPLAHLARIAGFPLLAEPTSQLRCGPHDRSHVITGYDLLLRDERFRGTASPDLVLRFGEMPTSKPLRSWLAGSGADQIVVDPLAGWNEPTRRAAAILRADPTELAAGWSARLGEERPAAGNVAERRARRPGGDRGGAGCARRAHRARPAAGARLPCTATATSSTPPRACRSATRSPSCPAARRTHSSSATAAPTESTASSPLGIGAAQATGRPTTIVTGDLGLLYDIGGLAALRDVSTPVRIVVIDNDGGGIFHFLPQESALDRERVRGPARHPTRRRRRKGRSPLRPRSPPAGVPRRPPRRPRGRYRPD